jgi:hypothetical protein
MIVRREPEPRSAVRFEGGPWPEGVSVGKEHGLGVWLLLVVAGVLLASCASRFDALSAQAESSLDACESAASCRVTGTLTIWGGHPYFGAAIETASGECVPAALSPAVIRERHKWNGRRVVAAGAKLVRAPDDAGMDDVVSIGALYRDRWLSSRTCPASVGSVLYVEQLVRR